MSFERPFLVEFDRGGLGHSAWSRQKTRGRRGFHKKHGQPKTHNTHVPRYYFQLLAFKSLSRRETGSLLPRLAPALLPDTCVRKLPSSLFALINDRRHVTRDNVVKSALSADHNRPDARWGGLRKKEACLAKSRASSCVVYRSIHTALDSILFSILIRDTSEIERHFKL